MQSLIEVEADEWIAAIAAMTGRDNTHRRRDIRENSEAEAIVGQEVTCLETLKPKMKRLHESPSVTNYGHLHTFMISFQMISQLNFFMFFSESAHEMEERGERPGLIPAQLATLAPKGDSGLIRKS